MLADVILDVSPMTTPIRRPAPTPTGLVRPGAATGARVLVVDDEPINVSLLERVLEQAGFTDVVGMTDPVAALAGLADLAPDVVLLDLHMPGVDGYRFLEGMDVVRTAAGFLPVLVLTADATPEARDRALSLGANDFLTKPFDRGEVVLRVTNLLQTRALYVEVQARNASLRADLDVHLTREREAARARQVRIDRLRAVLDDGQLTMHYQPITHVADGTVAGVEALARFTQTPPRSPDVWFAEAADVGMAEALELAAVAMAVADLPRLPADQFVSVNVSPQVAASPRLANLLADVDARRVVVELTEHEEVGDHDALLAALAPLRDRGVRLAVDDAGSGYAGLQQVLRLRPDVLKLDMALTRGLDTDPARRALVTAMLAFAEEIGSTIIAEGVETAEELAALDGLGVRWAQGFHLARPAAL